MATPYPAKTHIRSLALHLLGNPLSIGSSDTSTSTRHIIYIQGQHTTCRDDTDRELPFHQEANFHYLTGCLIPGSAVVIVLESGSAGDGEYAMIQTRLFVPPYDADAALWSVPPPTIEAIAHDGSSRKGSSTGTQKDVLEFDLSELGYVGAPLEEYISTLLLETDTASNAQTIIHLLSTNPLDPLFPIIPTPILSVLHPCSTASTPTLTDAHLRIALHRARLLKSALEISYIREANRVTSIAHEVLMRELGRFARVRSGDSRDREGQGRKENGVGGVEGWEIKSEQDAEAVFVATCKRLGANQAYLPIVASGSRASTLHYVCNDRLFPFNSNPASGLSTFSASSAAPVPPTPTTGRGCCSSIPSGESDLTGSFTPQVLLVDAGCEVRGGYASDVTRTIPIGNGGKFTEEGRWVYELVLKMQKVAEDMLRPGIHWDDIHFECHRILCEAFLEIGIFKEGTVEGILKKGLTAAFYPHGLGHSLGLDVHDSLQLLRSEYIDVPKRSHEHPSLFRYLRIRRPVVEGMVLTIEPGCYFSPELMESFGIRQSEHVDAEVLDRYTGVGGVRIEDVVVVTEHGCENLTTVGREADWIEAACSGNK